MVEEVALPLWNRRMLMDDLFARQYVNHILDCHRESLRIGFLGGSLTKGEMVKKDQCFVSLFEQGIREVVGDDREITILRYGESGTLSANALFRMGDLIAEKPDLVFVDYAMNDPGDRYLWETTEGILYQLLKAGSGVIGLLFCNDRGSCTRGAMERAASHYRIPVYDIGQKIFSQVQKGTMAWQDYAQDYVHPTVFGHQMIAGYLLDLFHPVAVPETNEDFRVPAKPAFEGAFRQTQIWDFKEWMKGAKPGDVIYEAEISFRMLLMEFYQDHVLNPASAMIALDGKRITSAEAYASMAWGNRVCRYIGGEGSLEKHRLTVTLGKGTPAAGWDYSQLCLRFLLGLSEFPGSLAD